MLTRRVLLWVVALGALLWGVHLAQLEWRASRRRELSRQLVKALDDYEWKSIARLIREGADPLTRGADGATALARAASLGDLSTLRIVFADPRFDLSVIEREFPELPTRKVDNSWDLAEQEESLARLVQRPDSERLANAWFALGLLRERLGRYPEATAAYRQAWHFVPTDAEVKARLAAAEEAGEIGARLSPTLPHGTRVLAAVPLAQGGKSDRWGVVYFQPGDPQQGSDYAWVRVRLYRAKHGKLIPVGAPLPVSDPRFDDPAASKVRVFGRDLTGDGIPELAVELMIQGASWAPSYLAVFSTRNDTLQPLLGLTSSEPLWLEDLNGDGKYEAGNTYEIGLSMSHAAQPRWTDIYAFDGQGYVLSNQRFPEEFREWPQTLGGVIQAHPKDPEILDYLGRTAEILGHPEEALGYYRWLTDVVLPEQIRVEGTESIRTDLRSRLKRLRQRRSALEARAARR